MINLNKWWQFILERFNPWSHLPMIFVFLLAHFFIATSTSDLLHVRFYLLLFIAIILFYFQLRLYDEVKDYALDCIINKNRPLPRGLLNHRQMYHGLMICIFINIFIFFLQGKESLLAYLIALSYSFLMYKEFFISKWIRSHLVFYAITHTFVTVLLSFSIFSFLTKLPLSLLIQNPHLFYFALINWCLFNIFEFGRKTFAKSEENIAVETYSKYFGQKGAVALVCSQILLACFLAFKLEHLNKVNLGWSLSALFIAYGAYAFLYLRLDSYKAASKYRTFSSFYIVLFYIILIFSHLTN